MSSIQFFKLVIDFYQARGYPFTRPAGCYSVSTITTF